MEWWLLIPAVLMGFVFGVHPPFGLAALIAIPLAVAVIWLLDPVGFGLLFYVSYGLAMLLPCIVMLYLGFRHYEREAARWQRKYDGGMLP